MSYILSIETATGTCSVSLTHSDVLLSYMEVNSPNLHSEKLTFLIEGALKSVNLDFEDLGAIAVSRGPGSYTGLRVGISTAKGLSMAIDKPIIAVDTLAAMALEVSAKVTNSLLCPMIDARRLEVYRSLYTRELTEVEPASSEILNEHSFREILKGNKMTFFGNGSTKLKKILNNTNAFFIDDVYPKAKFIGFLGYDKLLKKEFENVGSFEPFYLKDFVVN